ncbi:MAG: c-type cytochrome [Microscillaceae bacterium]|nr:c-type cytochrome [Microscillaceae bacterium]MDW8461719.1 cytochrome c3 family protein [Cytophagales bacterium]
MFSTSKSKWVKRTILSAYFVCSAITFLIAQADSTQKSSGSDAATLEKGKTLFNQNCVQCHGLGEEAIVGPGLKGLLDRRSEAWLIPWIRNSQAVIKSGDTYAVELYKKYNNTVMPAYPDFSDADIKAIIAYIDTESKKAPTTAAAISTPGASEGAVAQESGATGYLNALLIVLVVILCLIIAVLGVLLSFIKKYVAQEKPDLSEEDKELLNPKFDFGAIFRSSAFITGAAIFLVLVMLKSLLDFALDVGIQQGYAPVQPIAFSHKLHAGEYKIECNYCHTGVDKGKQATIPGANTCMNCHGEIKRESPEIKKIYAAIENDQPIEWVRVHNLPDLAYFNHAQHVKVGQIQCSQCHGKVEEMEVVQQRATLTMGWCINCHRQTVVKAEGNAYYDKLMFAHRNQGGKQLKVENIGGLECSKCHY